MRVCTIGFHFPLSVAALIEALKDRDKSIRIAAAYAVGEIVRTPESRFAL